MTEPAVFDNAECDRLSVSRMAVLQGALPQVKEELDFQTEADVSRGVGYFSEFLRLLGFRVVGIDDCEASVIKARRQYPEIGFGTGNAENLSWLELSSFDLILCFGQLLNEYHVFDHSLKRRKSRTVLVVSRSSLKATRLTLLLEPVRSGDPGRWGLWLERVFHNGSQFSVPGRSCTNRQE